MFVVNTTSATVGAPVLRRRPRNRVPSSRRRNPGIRFWLLTRVCESALAVGRILRNGFERYRRSRRRRGWRHRRRRQGAIEDGLGNSRPKRQEREDERQPEEDSTAPPARTRQEVAGLSGTQDRVRGAAGTAEARGKSTALSGLHEDGRDERDAYENQNDDQEGVHRRRGVGVV